MNSMPVLKTRNMSPSAGIALSANALVPVSGICSAFLTSARLKANKQKARHTATMNSFSFF